MISIYRYNAKVVRVTDGDTIVVLLDMGLRDYRVEALRIKDLWSPELNTVEGKNAKAFVAGLLPADTPVVVQTFKDTLSFNRYVADVWLLDGRDLATVVIEAAHGTAEKP